MLDAFVERLPDEGDISIVGAGSGQQATELARLRPKCQFYAIEPDPSHFAALTGAAWILRNISLIQGGFSGKEGQVLFPDWPDENSTVVAAMTLDAYAVPRRHNVAGILIANRCDEPAVIAGATETLRRQRSWLCMNFAPRELAGSRNDPTKFSAYLLSNFDVELGRDNWGQCATGVVLMRLNGISQLNH